MSIPNNYRRRVPVYTDNITTIVEESTAPQPATLGYTDGVLTSVVKGGETKTLTYQDGRLVKVSGSNIVTLEYDNAGRLAKTTVSNA